MERLLKYLQHAHEDLSKLSLELDSFKDPHKLIEKSKYLSEMGKFANEVGQDDGFSSKKDSDSKKKEDFHLDNIGLYIKDQVDRSFDPNV